MEEIGLSEKTKEYLKDKISDILDTINLENRLNMPDSVTAGMMVEFLNTVVIAKQEAELYRMSRFTIESI